MTSAVSLTGLSNTTVTFVNVRSVSTLVTVGGVLSGITVKVAD
jgi:hypothetical protein